MYKHFIEDKKAVFFDFDGTLADTVSFWEEAFEKVVVDAGLSVSDYNSRLSYTGYTLTHKWETFLSVSSIQPQLTIPELIRQTENVFVRLAVENELNVRAGFWELAAELKKRNLTLGLTSNSKRYIIDSMLQLMRLTNVFELIITVEDVSNPKPHREIYSTACKRLNILPNQGLAFEDSVAGATSSSRAGLETVVIWDGSSPQKSYPANIVYFFPDFTALVDNLDKDMTDLIREFVDKVEKNPNPLPENEEI